jgi:phytanoyl-CoA hydroxylase
MMTRLPVETACQIRVLCGDPAEESPVPEPGSRPVEVRLAACIPHSRTEGSRMKVLTSSQHERFQSDGCLILERYLNEADLQPVMEELNAMVDQLARRLLAEGKIRALYEEEGIETRLASISQESREALHAINGTEWDGPALFRLLTHPRLLDLAEDLVGPEVLGYTAYRFCPKLPDAASIAGPWHQDAAYWTSTSLAEVEPILWIPFVDATRENGCMELIAGAHRLGLLPHYWEPISGSLDMRPEFVPEGPRVVTEVPRGTVVLLTHLTPRRSLPNLSRGVHWSVDIRYQDARRPSGYPLQAAFLARSRERPQEVVTEPAVLERRRGSDRPPAG